MTGFIQQQPAGVAPTQQSQLPTVTGGTGGVQELPLDMKAIHDHMAVQALIRSYQVRIVFVVFFCF